MYSTHMLRIPIKHYQTARKFLTRSDQGRHSGRVESSRFPYRTFSDAHSIILTKDSFCHIFQMVAMGAIVRRFLKIAITVDQLVEHGTTMWGGHGFKITKEEVLPC